MSGCSTAYLEALRMLQASMLGTSSPPSEGTSVEVAPSGAQGAGSGRSGAGPALVACPCPEGCSHRPCRPRGSQACLRTRGQPCPCTSLWAPPGVSRSYGCCCPHKRGAGGAGAGGASQAQSWRTCYRLIRPQRLLCGFCCCCSSWSNIVCIFICYNAIKECLFLFIIFQVLGFL